MALEVNGAVDLQRRQPGLRAGRVHQRDLLRTDVAVCRARRRGGLTDTTVPVTPGVPDPAAVGVVVIPGVPGRGVGDGVGVAPGVLVRPGVLDAEGVGEASGLVAIGVGALRSVRAGADTTGVKSARTLDASVGFIAVTGSIVMPLV